MKTLLIILLMTLPVIIHAEYSYTKPQYILLDKDKNPVPNVTKSNDDSRCLHKASMQPTGTYYCAQEAVKVIVNNDTNNATVSWTAPTQNTDNTPLTDLTGYCVYYGLSESDLSTKICTEDTNLLITGLLSNTYYFGVRAVNSNGIESELSNIVTKAIN